MRTRTYTPAEWLRRNGLALRFTSGPPRPGDWRPAPGSSAIVFRNAPGVREVRLVCEHGVYSQPLDDWEAARRRFGVGHPQCPLGWTRSETWPAQAAVRNAFGVTGTADAATQQALAAVRAAGAKVEAFLIVNRCRGCTPGCAETNPAGHPEASTLELLHERNCRASGRRDGV